MIASGRYSQVVIFVIHPLLFSCRIQFIFIFRTSHRATRTSDAAMIAIHSNRFHVENSLTVASELNFKLSLPSGDITPPSVRGDIKGRRILGRWGGRRLASLPQVRPSCCRVGLHSHSAFQAPSDAVFDRIDRQNINCRGQL